MNLIRSISAVALLTLVVSAAAGVVRGDEPAVAELPIPHVSAIAIIAPASSYSDPRIVLIDLYPNRLDSCTDIVSRGEHPWTEASIHPEKDGWRFEARRLTVHAGKILLLGEKADGNGYRWVGERRLRAGDEVEAELP